MRSLRVIFAGTPDFSVPCLQALIDSDHHICAVYTQPDRPAGRGRHITASPVKKLAQQHAIPVYQPKNLRHESEQTQLKNLQADVMIVVAYGLILPSEVLMIPRLGCVNVHASLLPRWRGAAPIQGAILAGDELSGITIMQMDEGLDTGDILMTTTCAIKPEQTASALHDHLAQMGAGTLLDALSALQAGTLIPVPQENNLSTYAAKITKEDARIDWSLTAKHIALQIRAYNAWPVSFCYIKQQPLRIWQAEALSETSKASPGVITQVSEQGIDIATGNGLLRLHVIQLPGGRPLKVADILHSKRELFQLGQFLQ